MSTTYTRKQVSELVDGVLDWETVRRMLFMPKDPERFAMYIDVLQERQKWDDKIILPLGPHLYIVEDKNGDIVNKCDCGFVFGPYTENWKLNALIYVRDSEEKFNEVYPKLMSPDAEWQVYREYYCPIEECGTMHDVEAPTPWYPVIHDFEPDIAEFYKWVGLEAPKGIAA